MKLAVTYDADGADLNQVGVTLFVVVTGLGVVTLLMAGFGRRTTVSSERESSVQGQPEVQRQRDFIVERDEF